MWDKAKVLRLLDNPLYGNRTALKGVWYLWLYQTNDEQVSFGTKHQNNVGFSRLTAAKGTKIGAALNTVVTECGGESLVPWERALYLYKWDGTHFLRGDTIAKWLEEAKRIVARHAGQVAKIANARHSKAA